MDLYPLGRFILCEEKIKGIIKSYFAQLHASKTDNLSEMDGHLQEKSFDYIKRCRKSL